MCVQMFPSEMPGLSWRDPSSQLCVFFQGRSADGFSRVKRSPGDRVFSSVGGCNLALGAHPLLQVHLWGVTVIQRASFDSDWLPAARPPFRLARTVSSAGKGLLTTTVKNLKGGSQGPGLVYVLLSVIFNSQLIAQLKPTSAWGLGSDSLYVFIHYCFNDGSESF